MTAYLIADVTVSDPEVYEQYKPRFAALLERHKGRFISRASQVTVLEGDWQPSRIVVMAFDTDEQVHAFLESREYGALKELRSQAATNRLVLLTGSTEG